jgi:hypothetical protein
LTNRFEIWWSDFAQIHDGGVLNFFLGKGFNTGDKQCLHSWTDLNNSTLHQVTKQRWADTHVPQNVFLVENDFEFNTPAGNGEGRGVNYPPARFSSNLTQYQIYHSRCFFETLSLTPWRIRCRLFGVDMYFRFGAARPEVGQNFCIPRFLRK